jgi:hypothetical protein
VEGSGATFPGEGGEGAALSEGSSNAGRPVARSDTTIPDEDFNAAYSEEDISLGSSDAALSGEDSGATFPGGGGDGVALA